MSRKFFTIFEHHRQPLATGKVFMKRVFKCAGLAACLLFISIFIGAAIYRYVEGQSWLEGALNAIMIMTGLGLVDTLRTDAAKLFTCFYAVITAIVFYVVLAIIFAPLIHRFLHIFHLELNKKGEND